MIQDGSGLYADMQFNDECTHTTARFGVRIENHPVKLSACIPLSPQQTYYLSMNWDLANGMATLFVYTPAREIYRQFCVCCGHRRQPKQHPAFQQREWNERRDIQLLPKHYDALEHRVSNRNSKFHEREHDCHRQWFRDRRFLE